MRGLLFDVARQGNRLPLQQEAAFHQVENTLVSVPILEADYLTKHGLVHAHHCADKVVATYLNNHSRFCWNFWVLLLLCALMACKDVAAVWIDTHGPKVYLLNFAVMDMRAEVWSPLQNTAVWLGAWLWGHESTDDLLDAMQELGGLQVMEDEAPFVDLLAYLRAETSEIVQNLSLIHI